MISWSFLYEKLFTPDEMMILSSNKYTAIINSFILAEKHGHGKVYNSRLSNGPMESINRKVKDLKRIGRGYRIFEHFRNRFLYATRQAPVLNGVTDYNPVLYFDNDDNY